MNMTKKALIPILACAALAAVPALAQDAIAEAAPEAAPAAEAPAETPAAAEAAPAAEAPAPEAAPAAAPAEAPAAEAPAPEAAPAAAPEAAPAAAEVDVPAEQEVAGVKVGESSDSSKITVSLDGVELPDVVRLFTRLSGANIICNATNLHGTVTANLDNVDWQPALTRILSGQGLQLREEPPESGIFVIEPKILKPAQPWDDWVTETFRLNYVKASEASKMLESFLGVQTAMTMTSANASGRGAQPVPLANRGNNKSQYSLNEEYVTTSVFSNGRVVAYPAGNLVVVSADPDIMREVKKVIKEIDIPRQQVYVEAKIVQLSGSDAKKFGIDWGFLDGYKITAGPFNRSYQHEKFHGAGDSQASVANRLYTRNVNGDSSRSSSKGYSYSEGRAGDTATGDETSTSDSSFSSSTSSKGESVFPDSVGDGSIWSSLYHLGPTATSVDGREGVWNTDSKGKTRYHESRISDVRTAIFSADAMEVVISALQTLDDQSQIANPKVVVANEEHAVIDMTRKVPYVEVQKTINGSGSELSENYSSQMKLIPQVQNDEVPYIEGAFFAYGIRLDVTPRINNASNITVVIEPTISTKAGEVFSGTDTAYPIIAAKRVKTTFSLGDNQTAVIGGLTTTSENEVTKKIPILGDIPLIGKYLFSHTSKQKVQEETIIFVTVGIVNPEDKASRMQMPDGARLVHGHIDADGKIIDRNLDNNEALGFALPDEVEPAK